VLICACVKYKEEKNALNYVSLIRFEVVIYKIRKPSATARTQTIARNQHQQRRQQQQANCNSIDRNGREPSTAGKSAKTENQYSRDTNNSIGNERHKGIPETAGNKRNQQEQGHQQQQETNKNREANNSRELTTSTARTPETSWDYQQMGRQQQEGIGDKNKPICNSREPATTATLRTAGESATGGAPTTAGNHQQQGRKKSPQGHPWVVLTTGNISLFTKVRQRYTSEETAWVTGTKYHVWYWPGVAWDDGSLSANNVRYVHQLGKTPIRANPLAFGPVGTKARASLP
jgi:hypothetical protein